MHRRSPPKSTLETTARPDLPEPNEHKSPAPPTIVEAWCIGVESLNREQLDRFTRRIWKKFDPADLEPLKAAILRRRRVLAGQAVP